MAQTQARETQTEETATAWSAVNAFVPMAKEMLGLQMKTAQMMFDQTTKLTQTFADFYQTQAQESLKLTQACVATGKGVAEELRRTATTMAEKVTAKN
jgi:hemoglobin-like flavoprotein